jgi:hypothetical protein
MSFYDYIFGPQREKDGSVLPFSRFDIVLSVVLGVCLLAAIAYSAKSNDGWTLGRAISLGIAFVIVMLIAQRRKVVLGEAFAIVTGRFIIGIVITPSHYTLIPACVICGVITWALLKETH